MSQKLSRLLAQVRACSACDDLPLGPRPTLRAAASARVLIVGQAPGIRVHETGVPWNDPSGERLRAWMGIDREMFYDTARIAIIPIGLCYPGSGARGDLPPRKHCMALWGEALRTALPQIELTLLVGQYAHAHYLGARRKPSLTATVQAYRDYLPQYLPLPHPSGRNNIWLKRNPWFERRVLPTLRRRLRVLL